VALPVALPLTLVACASPEGARLSVPETIQLRAGDESLEEVNRIREILVVDREGGSRPLAIFSPPDREIEITHSADLIVDWFLRMKKTPVDQPYYLLIFTNYKEVSLYERTTGNQSVVYLGKTEEDPFDRGLPFQTRANIAFMAGLCNLLVSPLDWPENLSHHSHELLCDSYGLMAGLALEGMSYDGYTERASHYHDMDDKSIRAVIYDFNEYETMKSLIEAEPPVVITQ
jgi:hypothetical protein